MNLDVAEEKVSTAKVHPTRIWVQTLDNDNSSSSLPLTSAIIASRAISAMRNDDVDEIAAIPLPTSPRIEEGTYDANSLGRVAALAVDAQEMQGIGKRVHEPIPRQGEGKLNGSSHLVSLS